MKVRILLWWLLALIGLCYLHPSILINHPITVLTSRSLSQQSQSPHVLAILSFSYRQLAQYTSTLLQLSSKKGSMQSETHPAIQHHTQVISVSTLRRMEGVSYLQWGQGERYRAYSSCFWRRILPDLRPREVAETGSTIVERGKPWVVELSGGWISEDIEIRLRWFMQLSNSDNQYHTIKDWNVLPWTQLVLVVLFPYHSFLMSQLAESASAVDALQFPN